jgi:hypothetical protein
MSDDPITVVVSGEPVAIVKLSDGVFTSITTGGAVVGTFPTLQEAARALPDGSAS